MTLSDARAAITFKLVDGEVRWIEQTATAGVNPRAVLLEVPRYRRRRRPAAIEAV